MTLSDDSIFLSIQNTPITLLVGYIKDKLTFETSGINKIQEYENPFIMRIFKFIENLE